MKISEDAPDRLLEIVVEQCKLAYRVVELEDRDDECKEGSCGENVVIDLLPAQQQKQGNGDRAEDIHQRRTDGGRGHGAQVGAEQALRRFGEAGNLPGLHAEGFHDAVAGDGLVQNVLNVGQLVLASARGVANPVPDAVRPKK